MADLPLFTLDAEGRWRLAYDSLQWIIQRRIGTPCRRDSDSAAMRSTGWRAVSFVAGEKRVLPRVLGEHGVVRTPEAQARLDALPERFADFLAAVTGRRRDVSQVLEHVGGALPNVQAAAACVPGPGTHVGDSLRNVQAAT